MKMHDYLRLCIVTLDEGQDVATSKKWHEWSEVCNN